jgi:hypothetical protein
MFEMSGDETQTSNDSRMTNAASPFRTRHSSVVMRGGLVVPCFFVLVVAGCGRSGPVTYPVTGTVSYNGAVVADGSIVFIPVDRHLAAEGGKITDGRFALSAKAGQNRVEIRATREVGKVIPSMGVKARQSYIPATYNSESALTSEVVPGGKNQFTFDLKGPPLGSAD